MNEKLEILAAVMPKAILKAMTREAVEAVPNNPGREGVIVITHFPFRIGRESRLIEIRDRQERVERVKQDSSMPNNDLYLVDRGPRLNISREHLQIEKRGEQYLLVDRGSASGTKLEGVNIGGGKVGKNTAPLKDGDTIGIGASNTPYIYQFISFDEYELASKTSELSTV